jgi:hypothetical protein
LVNGEYTLVFCTSSILHREVYTTQLIGQLYSAFPFLISYTGCKDKNPSQAFISISCIPAPVLKELFLCLQRADHIIIDRGDND